MFWSMIADHIVSLLFRLPLSKGLKHGPPDITNLCKKDQNVKLFLKMIPFQPRRGSTSF